MSSDEPLLHRMPKEGRPPRCTAYHRVGRFADVGCQKAAGDHDEHEDRFGNTWQAITDVVTRCVPAEGIHATPHNGPCVLRAGGGSV